MKAGHARFSSSSPSTAVAVACAGQRQDHVSIRLAVVIAGHRHTGIHHPSWLPARHDPRKGWTKYILGGHPERWSMSDPQGQPLVVDHVLTTVSLLIIYLAGTSRS